MTDPFAHAQIPSSSMPGSLAALDFLIRDLRTLEDCLVEERPIPLHLAIAVENAAVCLLDELSPEVRQATAKAYRFAEAPKMRTANGGSR